MFNNLITKMVDSDKIYQTELMSNELLTSKNLFKKDVTDGVNIDIIELNSIIM